MLSRFIINLTAFCELFIGFSTLAGMAIFENLSLATKPANVLVFVTLTAVISILLGVGLLKNNKKAATLLVFFSGYIILTKALIFSGLLHFNGEILTALAANVKNLISVVYHGFVILVLTRPSVKSLLR